RFTSPPTRWRGEKAAKVNKRLNKLRSRLAEKAIDAILITQPQNRRYLSGFHGTAGYLIITNKQAVLATDFRYTEQAKEQAPDFEIKQISASLEKWFPALVGEMGINRLGFEGGNISFNFHRQIANALKKQKCNVKMVLTGGLVEEIRATKEPDEIEFIKRASAITDAAFEEVEMKIKAGMTEKQVAWELEKDMRERGSQSLPFDIIVASGPDAALPHAIPTDRLIKTGEPVVIDMGARYQGYASDLSRTICVGKADTKYKEVYNIVLKAQTVAMEAITKGMTGNQADKIARDIIKTAGYGEAFGHSLGHGVGLAEHELPRLGPRSKDRLADGMVFTVEPGIYLTGWGGVRIEDTVVMEGGRVKMITKARKMTC
ncbi:MAG: aminopeptidase P family protein, partial [Dehalococcoidales bacterium]|nr:aminopeptidase P family protein [Dehalococcoidales bacterium]